MMMRRWALSLFLSATVLLPPAAAVSGAQTLNDPAVLKSFQEAKTKWQAGINAWNRDLFKEARDLFLGCLMRTKPENVYLEYYVALADLHLASYAIATEDMAECERASLEGQQYLEKAMALDPGFAEAEAVYGYLIGLQLAVHPEQAMILGLKSMQHMERAMTADPANPRIQFLKGFYQLYVPEAFGGGPDSALPFFEKAIALFEKENIIDPLKPSWGKDTALTNAALIYKGKKNEAKAVELLKKALAANPDYGQAKAELAALEKKAPL